MRLPALGTRYAKSGDVEFRGRHCLETAVAHWADPLPFRHLRRLETCGPGGTPMTTGMLRATEAARRLELPDWLRRSAGRVEVCGLAHNGNVQPHAQVIVRGQVAQSDIVARGKALLGRH